MRLRHHRATGRSGCAVEDALLDRLCALSTELAARPDEVYRAAARSRLVAMAAVRTPETGAVRRPQSSPGVLRRLLAPSSEVAHRRSRLTAGLTGAALTVTALGGMLAVAQDARPGDLLYGLKVGSEHTRLALASDSTRGLTLLNFATIRLEELTELARADASALPAAGVPSSGGQTLLAAGPDVAVVVDTLGTMDDQTTKGTWWFTTQAVRSPDPAALSTLIGWARGQSTGLADLGTSIPASAEQAFTASADLIAAVATRGVALEEAVTCASGPAVDGTDDLGPVPAPCPPPAVPSGTTAPTAPGTGSTGSTAAIPTTDVVPPGAAGLPSLPAPSSGDSLPVSGGGAATTPALPGSGGSLPAPPSIGVPGSGGLPLPPLPTGTATSTTPPLIQIPLPVVPPRSTPVCIGAICIGA
ncbi:hypothetical protein [Modestobacter sp. DSM 44400]|uniref:hypothetical protein n=1 Tax=Modestobacter sp. DSM 44400 TaxID=1550230 RepID=UPI000B85872B|nr:hypothetical protein [Modestobacter sp. DSM 44400]